MTFVYPSPIDNRPIVMEDIGLNKTVKEYLERLIDIMQWPVEYSRLLGAFIDKPFDVINSKDSSRVADARRLRLDFCEEIGIGKNLDVAEAAVFCEFGGIRVLEVLAGMMVKLFEDGWLYINPPKLVTLEWLKNLGMETLTNSIFRECPEEASHKLDIWLAREFKPNGEGSPWKCEKASIDFTERTMFDQATFWAEEFMEGQNV